MMKNYYLSGLLFLFSFFNFSVVSAQNASQIGQWSNPIPFDIIPVAVANLPDGRIITWSSKYHDSFGGADGYTFTQVFDPSIGSIGSVLPRTVTQTNHDMFCPGINNLPDGRIMATGGSSSERSSIYNTVTETWERADDMNLPRGYQGAVTLSDGSVFTIGGSWSGGRGNKDAEIWTPETGWNLLVGLPNEILWNTADANSEPQGVYRLDNHAWLWAAPNGKIFHAGPSENMHWIDVKGDTGRGTYTTVGKRGNDTYSINGNTVMFDIGKLLKIGGSKTYSSNSPANENSYVIDINDENNVNIVATANTMDKSRIYVSSTVLPNGEVLVLGGMDNATVFSDAGAFLSGEMYNPTTNSFRSMASMQVPRTYHSAAILLNDGRVFIGGGGLCGNCADANHLDAEIYSPPYLFNANGSLAVRPTINAPEIADYNTEILVSGSTNITSFNLIRLSSATHSVNNEQRRIPVNFTQNGDAYNVSIPSRELLPPGYYMLFAIDNSGVPSIAETIKIGSTLPITNSRNLVLDLSFDKGSGVTVEDGSIYGNNATIVERDNAKNPIPVTQNYWTTEGLFGSAMEMDGKEFESNSIVEVPYSSSMASVKTEITVMAWVYRDEIEKNVAILAHDYPKLFFGFHNSLYKWEFPTSNGSSVNCYVGYSPAKKWVHIAATYDGKVGRLYANGVEICSDKASGEITMQETGEFMSSFTSSGFYDRRQAQSLSGITDELDGRIDELKVFNKALGSYEISAFYDLGKQQYNPDLIACDSSVIVAEYKIGKSGVWQTGNTINANIEEEVYIRANVVSGEEYFVTLPFNQQNKFSSITDFPSFEDTTAYKIDTFNGGNGLVSSNNRGQYALTTANGCVAVVDLKVIGDCSTIEQEYRINGIWQNGQSEITVDEGDEIMLSILPNGIGLTITLPDGSLRGGDFNLGNVTVADAGTYVLTGDNDCSKTLKINVRSNLDCHDISITPSVNQNAISVTDEITLKTGDTIDLSLSPGGVDYYVTAPDGSLLAGDSTIGYTLNNITKEQEGIYLFNTTLTGAENNKAVLFVGSEEISAENGRAINAIDDDSSTIWHTKWSTANDSQPHEIQLDLGELTNVEGLTYLPRQNGSMNGTIADYEIYVTSDVTDWGEAVNIGTWEANRTLKIASFIGKEGRYVRLRSLREINGNPWTSAAEIDVIKGEIIGCVKTLEIKIIEDSCDIEPEYLVNETWSSGESEITVNTNDVIWLSMSPEDVDFTVTDSNGNAVIGNYIDGYYLGYMNADKAGDYIFTTAKCSKVLKINVSGDSCNIEPEYLVNDTWSSGESEITVNANDVIWLSMSPENVEFSVTNPDGEAVVGDTNNGYFLGYMSNDKAGDYTFITVNGCSKVLKINVSGVNCNITPEYLVNSSWSSGESKITLSINDVVWLSMSPENLDFTVTDPQGNIVNGNSIDGYYLGYMQINQSGTYTFNASNGCTSSLEINVVGTNFRVRLEGAKPIVESKGLALYPNPSTGIFEIYLGDGLRDKPLQIRIYDMTGQEVYSKFYNENKKGEIHMNVSTLANGAYNLIVNTEGEETITKSILINK